MKKVEKKGKKEASKKPAPEQVNIQNMIEDRIKHIKENFSGGIRGNKKW